MWADGREGRESLAAELKEKRGHAAQGPTLLFTVRHHHVTRAWTSLEGAARTVAHACVSVSIVLRLASHRNARALDRNCEVAAFHVGFRKAQDQPRGRPRAIPGFSPPWQPEDRLVASHLEVS